MQPLSLYRFESFNTSQEEAALFDRVTKQAASFYTPSAKNLAHGLIAQCRSHAPWHGGFDAFLQHYRLDTGEGLALMGIAEALLRIPDTTTADELIEDKLAAFLKSGSRDASSPLLTITGRMLHVSAVLSDSSLPEKGIMQKLCHRLGMPAVRLAVKSAVSIMSSHFIRGQTIKDALQHSPLGDDFPDRYSFDMLGEGARTTQEASRYFAAYRDAIHTLGDAAQNISVQARPGISVKLSALHPRYEPLNRDCVLSELTPLVLELARDACRYNLTFTVDAEEAERLELSLDVISAVVGDQSLKGWDGFGLAVQAYNTQAQKVLHWLGELAVEHDRRFMVRLVKGAYWDTEIKRAQERGLAAYPVFTQKAATDLNFLACADIIFNNNRFFGQFASHNALTVAQIYHRGKGKTYEFQRLHGMGEELYAALREQTDEALPCRIYAPVGKHSDLLAYLVRRLLENSANTSFLANLRDTAIPIEALVEAPQDILRRASARPQSLPLPRDLYGHDRINSAGMDWGNAAAVAALQEGIEAYNVPLSAAPLINGHSMSGAKRNVFNPARPSQVIGSVVEGDGALVNAAMQAAHDGAAAWRETSIEVRAECLERAADMFEANRFILLGLLQREAGKTIQDAYGELREAVDFCRYYAAEARRVLRPQAMPGCTGETNNLLLRGRGVFVCISPWNFPMAIFTGQIVAALVAGNAVVAKPAEQTPLIAAHIIQLLLQAGITPSALHFLPGGKKVGEALVAHSELDGVAFTGSTETAWSINRALAAKNAPIVPLIAETGGINAMLVDASALIEQVVDDVIASAFRSAGQRCSALRLLCVQEELFEPLMTMLTGALKLLKVNDPLSFNTDIGPVIDAEAQQNLERYCTVLQNENAILMEGKKPDHGFYVAPRIIVLECMSELKKEVFGPILHVMPWKAGELVETVKKINNLGYGLTLGIHSRIERHIKIVSTLAEVGNVYVNRNIIGAMVGTQPFGGCKLSGTGPKAGGPYYLQRFCTEKVVTVNIAAAGGNASLLMGTPSQ